jgi:hypothetical protein
MRRALWSSAWRRNQISRSLVRPITPKSGVRNILTNQRFSQNVVIDDIVSEHGFGMSTFGSLKRGTRLCRTYLHRCDAVLSPRKSVSWGGN